MRDNIYIIIVTYNGMQWINKCLTSTRNSSQNLQTIVIDNASTDETVTFIRKEFPEVILLPQKQNLGFGKANNIGLNYVIEKKSDYVFLLNQDAYLDKNTIEILIDTHLKNKNFGILSPIHLNGNKTKLDKSFSNYLGYEKSNEFYRDAIFNKMKPVYSIPFVNAAAWLLPKKTLENIGGFDPLFFHYGEDNNYCDRVLYHGYKIGVVTSCFVVHDREFENKREITTLDKRISNSEVNLKVELSNININFDTTYNYKLKKSRIEFLKSIIKFKNFKFCKKYFFLIVKIKKEIEQSRLQNKKIGTNYIK